MASASPKKVVVLGAGYAGASVAAKLDRMKEIDVTLVTPRDFILHKIGSLRAAVKGGAWYVYFLLLRVLQISNISIHICF